MLKKFLLVVFGLSVSNINFVACSGYQTPQRLRALRSENSAAGFTGTHSNLYPDGSSPLIAINSRVGNTADYVNSPLQRTIQEVTNLDDYLSYSDEIQSEDESSYDYSESPLYVWEAPKLASTPLKQSIQEIEAFDSLPYADETKSLNESSYDYSESPLYLGEAPKLASTPLKQSIQEIEAFDSLPYADETKSLNESQHGYPESPLYLGDGPISTSTPVKQRKQGAINADSFANINELPSFNESLSLTTASDKSNSDGAEVGQSRLTQSITYEPTPALNQILSEIPSFKGHSFLSFHTRIFEILKSLVKGQTNKVNLFFPLTETEKRNLERHSRDYSIESTDDNTIPLETADDRKNFMIYVKNIFANMRMPVFDTLVFNAQVVPVTQYDLMDIINMMHIFDKVESVSNLALHSIEEHMKHSNEHLLNKTELIHNISKLVRIEAKSINGYHTNPKGIFKRLMSSSYGVSMSATSQAVTAFQNYFWTVSRLLKSIDTLRDFEQNREYYEYGRQP